MGRVECGAVYAGLKKIQNLELFWPGQRFDSLNLLTPVFQVLYDVSRHLVLIHGTIRVETLRGHLLNVKKADGSASCSVRLYFTTPVCAKC